MKRLTVKGKDGRWALADNGEVSKFEMLDKIPRAVERLAAYEDTGMEPEGVMELLEKFAYEFSEHWLLRKRIEDMGGINHLEELAQVENDGRLVVLPCKIGDTVYFLENGEIKETEVESIHQWVSGHWKVTTHTDRMSTYWTGYEINFAEVGKTVFLTREEAEAALEKEKT